MLQLTLLQFSTVTITRSTLLRWAFNVSRVLVARLKLEEVDESPRRFEQGKSDTLTGSKYCHREAGRLVAFSSSFRILYQASRGGAPLNTFIPLSHIISCFILQHYALILWLSASIQWAIAAFAGIICSYPHSVVGQLRHRVSLGIHHRDTSSGGACQTLNCEIYYRDGSKPCSRESSKTSPPA